MHDVFKYFYEYFEREQLYQLMSCAILNNKDRKMKASVETARLKELLSHGKTPYSTFVVFIL